MHLLIMSDFEDSLLFDSRVLIIMNDSILINDGYLISGNCVPLWLWLRPSMH